jgi:hypothetical protein
LACRISLAVPTGATLCFFLLRQGGPGVWSHLSFFWGDGRSPFPASDLPDEFRRISFRACRLRLSTRDSERKHVDHAGSGGIGKRWAAREDLYAIERLADGYRAPHPLSEARLYRPGRLATGSKSRVAHHQVAVVKRWANQDRSKIIFADSGQLASHGQS